MQRSRSRFLQEFTLTLGASALAAIVMLTGVVQFSGLTASNVRNPPPEIKHNGTPRAASHATRGVDQGAGTTNHHTFIIPHPPSESVTASDEGSITQEEQPNPEKPPVATPSFLSNLLCSILHLFCSSSGGSQTTPPPSPVPAPSDVRRIPTRHSTSAPTPGSRCLNSECGPQPLNTMCADGSLGGSTGLCLHDANGTCAWQPRNCPLPFGGPTPVTEPPTNLPPSTCPAGSFPAAQLAQHPCGRDVCSSNPVSLIDAPGCLRCGAMCQSCLYCKAIGPTPFNCDQEQYCGMSGDSCTDSDGGFNLEERGVVNPGTGHAGEKTDYCISVDTVNEFMCPMNPGPGTPAWGDYINHKIKEYKTPCPSGGHCIQGACVRDWEMPVTTCVDTDGPDPMTFGTVTVDGVKTFKDACPGGAEEWSCKNGNTLVHTVLPCPEGTFCFWGEGSCTTDDTGQGFCGDGICQRREHEPCLVSPMPNYQDALQQLQKDFCLSDCANYRCTL